MRSKHIRNLRTICERHGGSACYYRLLCADWSESNINTPGYARSGSCVKSAPSNTWELRCIDLLHHLGFGWTDKLHYWMEIGNARAGENVGTYRREFMISQLLNSIGRNKFPGVVGTCFSHHPNHLWMTWRRSLLKTYIFLLYGFFYVV